MKLWERGTQARIAEEMGVHRSTVCRYVRFLRTLHCTCPCCGSWIDRERLQGVPAEAIRAALGLLRDAWKEKTLGDKEAKKKGLAGEAHKPMAAAVEAAATVTLDLIRKEPTVEAPAGVDA